jgi:hypothetical protein
MNRDIINQSKKGNTTMTKINATVKSTWEDFNKFVGVQGLMALVLLSGFVFASVKQTPLPEIYMNLMTLVVGYYFAKNGVGIVAALRGSK